MIQYFRGGLNNSKLLLIFINSCLLLNCAGFTKNSDTFEISEDKTIATLFGSLEFSDKTALCHSLYFTNRTTKDTYAVKKGLKCSSKHKKHSALGSRSGSFAIQLPLGTYDLSDWEVETLTGTVGRNKIKSIRQTSDSIRVKNYKKLMTFKVTAAGPVYNGVVNLKKRYGKDYTTKHVQARYQLNRDKGAAQLSEIMESGGLLSDSIGAGDIASIQLLELRADNKPKINLADASDVGLVEALSLSFTEAIILAPF